MKEENLKNDPRVKSCEMCNDSETGCGFCDTEVAPDTQENACPVTGQKPINDGSSPIRNLFKKYYSPTQSHIAFMKQKAKELRRASEIHIAKATQLLNEANQLEKFAESGNGVPQVMIEALNEYKRGHGY